MNETFDEMFRRLGFYDRPPAGADRAKSSAKWECISWDQYMTIFEYLLAEYSTERIRVQNKMIVIRARDAWHVVLMDNPVTGLQARVG